jgi:hypothetical protein
MKFMMAWLLAVAVATASFALSPDNSSYGGKKPKHTVKAAKSEKKVRRKVVDANPQHAGYPKADAKGNFPSKYNKHTYYID